MYGCADPSRPDRLPAVKLSEWLDEYRAFDPETVQRTVAEPIDDWQEQELLAADDRVRDPTPRWRRRAESVGYGPTRQF
jgi:hypothetical protein